MKIQRILILEKWILKTMKIGNEWMSKNKCPQTFARWCISNFKIHIIYMQITSYTFVLNLIRNFKQCSSPLNSDKFYTCFKLHSVGIKGLIVSWTNFEFTWIPTNLELSGKSSLSWILQKAVANWLNLNWFYFNSLEINQAYL